MLGWETRLDIWEIVDKMGSCLSSNHISIASKDTQTHAEPKTRPEPARFEDLVYYCHLPGSSFRSRLRMLSTVENDFPGQCAEFLYECVVSSCRDGYHLYTQYFFGRLCAMGDCEFVLRIVQDSHRTDWTVFSCLENNNPFYAYGRNTDAANHVMKVVLGTKNKQLLERHIMYFAIGSFAGIAVREFFLLARDVRRELDYYFFNQHIEHFNKDIPPLCRFLYSLGLPDDVLADIVSRGVGISVEYGVAMSCPPWDVVLLVIAWNVFGGRHMHLAQLILDMTGSDSTTWSNWAKATSKSIHFNSAGSRFGRDSIVYTVYSPSGKPEIRIAH